MQNQPTPGYSKKETDALLIKLLSVGILGVVLFLGAVSLVLGACFKVLFY